MATVTEKRAWLREHRPDLTVGNRGGLSRELETAWEEGQPGDYHDGVSEADFSGLEPGEAEPETPLTPERAPATPRSRRRAQTPRQRVGKLFSQDKQRDRKAKAKARAKHPRVSTEHVIGRVWEGLARVAQPLSLPVSACLQVQSRVAGPILEDVIAGTVVDRALQPIARAERKAETVLALVAPPVLVALIEQCGAMEAAGAITPQQAMMRRAILVPMLRETLRIWIDVAGPKIEEATQREHEYQEKYGHTIDGMIGLFFGQQDSAAYAEAEPEPEPEPAMAS